MEALKNCRLDNGYKCLLKMDSDDVEAVDEDIEVESEVLVMDVAGGGHHGRITLRAAN